MSGVLRSGISHRSSGIRRRCPCRSLRPASNQMQPQRFLESLTEVRIPSGEPLVLVRNVSGPYLTANATAFGRKCPIMAGLVRIAPVSDGSIRFDGGDAWRRFPDKGPQILRLPSRPSPLFNSSGWRRLWSAPIVASFSVARIRSCAVGQTV